MTSSYPKIKCVQCSRLFHQSFVSLTLPPLRTYPGTHTPLVSDASPHDAQQPPNSKTHVSVLSGVNADLQAGAITLLLGSNGAGKTTLLRTLCGLLGAPQGRDDALSKSSDGVGGSIELLSHSLSHFSSSYVKVRETAAEQAEWVEQAKQSPARSDSAGERQVGWCPQMDALYDDLTVEEHLQLFADLLNPLSLPYSNSHSHDHESESAAAAGSTPHPERERHAPTAPPFLGFLGPEIDPLECARADQRRDISQALARLNMSEHRHKPSHALSGGMKRRLSLCLAFAGAPKVLLLDEPSSGADACTRELIRQDILSRKRACAVLLSTHHVDDVEVLSGERVWFLDERFLVYDGPVSRLISRYQTGGEGVSTVPNSGLPAPTGAPSPLRAPASGEIPLHVRVPAPEDGEGDVEFSTSDIAVAALFKAAFGEQEASRWANAGESGEADIYTDADDVSLDLQSGETDSDLGSNRWQYDNSTSAGGVDVADSYSDLRTHPSYRYVICDM